MASSVSSKLMTMAVRLTKSGRCQSLVGSCGVTRFASTMIGNVRQHRCLTSFKGMNLPRASSVMPRRMAHSEVDEEISRFLDKEIKMEESSKAVRGVPQIKGFDVKTDGADVTLAKSQGSEKIVIKFNVNGTVDSDAHLLEESQGKDEPVQMVSRPSFTVEVTKADASVLAFQCSFPPSDEFEEGQSHEEGDQIADQFEIQEVALYKGEWKENVYSLLSDTMDGTLYDLLMDLLDERGINDDFVTELVKFSTAYEHGKYVEFLKGLRSFMGKK